MEYYSLLGLNKEPFSNSPDPGFFYYSPDYQECLQRLEISIRLRRGLNLILGNIGTGKTTISRILVNMFKQEKDRFLFHLILDPSFRSEFQFLSCLIDTFGITARARSTIGYKEALQDYLFQKGAHEQKIVVLLIDEGQKLTSPYIEILRNLLNFETNEYKLLQLIILAQMEFVDLAANHQNFMDRVNVSFTIHPLTLQETKDLIQHRLQTAGLSPGKEVFDDESIQYIHLMTQGYPRKIIQFCHHALVMSLIHSIGQGQALVQGSKDSLGPSDPWSPPYADKADKGRAPATDMDAEILVGHKPHPTTTTDMDADTDKDADTGAPLAMDAADAAQAGCLGYQEKQIDSRSPPATICRQGDKADKGRTGAPLAVVGLDIVQAVQAKSIFLDDEITRFKKNLQGLYRSYSQMQSHLHSTNKG